jgi:phage-related tail fiber protein
VKLRTRSAITVLAVLIPLATVSAAAGENYGTTRAQARQMTAMIYQTFGTGYIGQCFVKIAWRESGMNPRAANYGDSHGGSYGLLQLNGVHRWRGETMTQFRQRMWNPVTHLQAAKRLAREGFGPWRATRGTC